MSKLENWSRFLLDIRKPFFEYLRNLTPVTLFSAIGLYLWHKNQFEIFTFNLSNFLDTAITFIVFIIAIFLFLWNFVGFIKDIDELPDLKNQFELRKCKIMIPLIILFLICFFSIIAISIASVSMFNGFVKSI